MATSPHFFVFCTVSASYLGERGGRKGNSLILANAIASPADIQILYEGCLFYRSLFSSGNVVKPVQCAAVPRVPPLFHDRKKTYRELNNHEKKASVQFRNGNNGCGDVCGDACKKAHVPKSRFERKVSFFVIKMSFSIGPASTTSMNF